MWSRSELVLHYFHGGLMFFLNNLPDSLKSCIRRLVIPSGLLGADDAFGRTLWSKDKSKGGTYFTNWLSDNLPNLRTVAIEIPSTIEEMEWNWNPASDYLCDMLLNGRLDTVRFFYKENRQDKETDYSFLSHVALEGHTHEGEQESDRPLLIGVEEPISHTSLASQVWRDLWARRVVKITRSQVAA
jgi:hypothetical protein